MPISKQTATDIAMAYREVEAAEALLSQITEAIDQRATPDIRDAFGRLQGGLQLGVPSGQNGHRLYNVPWTLCRPVIEAHIASQKAMIAALTEKARAEIDAAEPGTARREIAMNAHTSIRTHAPKITDLRSVSHTGSHWVECKINDLAFVWFFDTEAAADRCRFGLEIAFGLHSTAKDSAADEYPEYTRACDASDRAYQFKMEQA